MQNLELKVRCVNGINLERIEVLARQAGASLLRTMQQRDTYFPASQGRLKLREWRQIAAQDRDPSRPLLANDLEAGEAGAALIAYLRPDNASSRLSDYLISPVNEPLMLRTLLGRALGTRVVVEKTRKLYQYGHTRIHLDIVKDLGSFVELETVFEDGLTAEDASAEHAAVITLLQLDKLPVIAHSYSDLLEGAVD